MFSLRNDEQSVISDFPEQNSSLCYTKRMPELRDLEFGTMALIYKDCFSKEPWNEDWSFVSACDQMLLYAEQCCDVSVYKESNQVNLLSGFAIGMPLDSFSGKAELQKFLSITGYYYIADFAVAPEIQGRGVGKQVLAELMRSSADKYPGIVLRTRSDNLSAIKVFKTLGFEEIGEYSATTGGQASVRKVFKFVQSL